MLRKLPGIKKISNFYDKSLKHKLITLFIWAFILNFAIEEIARKQLGGFLFLFQHPLVFTYNALIIFATLSISILFKKRRFFIVMVSSIWAAIGITNGIILIERMTPFTVKDFAALGDAATILTNYFSTLQLVLIASAIILAVVGIVFLWIKSPKDEKYGRFKKNIIVFILICTGTFGATVGLVKANVLATFFGNLAYAYSDYGIPYCFINTWLNTGIQRPLGYSQDSISDIVKKNNLAETPGAKIVKINKEDYSKEASKENPNIIFLQLESFVDPMLFKNIKYSQDPIPNFRKLMETESSGPLTVPACGAGTANTEFEVMTGVSVKFFGPGEYPFKSVLREKTVENIATDLKSLGYDTHAIHNHRALFYNRNEVFKNLGYDTFTSIEYMSDVPKTPKNWAKDRILVSQIMDTMKTTDAKDYIYTISVQGHGKYPPEKLIKKPQIEVLTAPSDEMKWKYEYYANQIYEMDIFVKQLIDELSKFDEPTVLVMYGDHIPALDVSESSYNENSLYETRYVIWSNFNLPKEKKALHAYQLAADVFDRLGMDKGTIIKYHQKANHKSKDYLNNLRKLSYDMFYGKDYIYGGQNPFLPSDMKMGIHPITINKVIKIGDKYYIKGNYFTEHSKVTLKGEALNTVYLGTTLLGLTEEVDPADAKYMKVSQIDRSKNEIITSTE